MSVTPFLARGLNALSLGEATANHLGIPVQRLKYVAIVAVAAATGASVAVSGGIGFVGIVVPHLLRLAIGPDNRYLLPASALLGASLLLLADAVSRTIVAPAELPIGIVTAAAGAPFFLWILLRKRGDPRPVSQPHDRSAQCLRIDRRQEDHRPTSISRSGRASLPRSSARTAPARRRF